MPTSNFTSKLDTVHAGHYDISKNDIATMFGLPEFRRLATSLRSRDNDAVVEMLDAAYWMKGCSSLGLLRFAVLLSIGEGKNRELALMDVK